MQNLEQLPQSRKIVMLRLDDEVWQKIKKTAREQDRTANGLARRFLKEGLERHLARGGRNV